MHQQPVVRFSLLLAGILLTACGHHSSPDVANAADAALPSAAESAAASAEVVATMRRVYDGFVNQDAAAVSAAVLTSGMLYVGPEGVASVTSPEGSTAMVKQCTVRRYVMDSVQTRNPAPSVVVLTFKLAIDETCGGQKSPSPDYVMSTWQRQGRQWRAVGFSATPSAGAR